MGGSRSLEAGRIAHNLAVSDNVEELTLEKDKNGHFPKTDVGSAMERTTRYRLVQRSLNQKRSDRQ